MATRRCWNDKVLRRFVFLLDVGLIVLLILHRDRHRLDLGRRLLRLICSGWNITIAGIGGVG